MYQDLHPHDTPPPPKEECRQRYLQALGAVDIFVAEADGTLVSTAMLAVVPNLTRGMQPFGVVENVVTAAGHRQKGLGRLVMSHLVEQARARGCYKLMVLSKQTTEAVSLYSGLGFTKDAKIGMTLRFGAGE